MFNKLKHIKDLRSQAKTMQKALATESVTVEKSGIKIVMDGNLEISNITINENLAKENLEELLKEAINETIKKVQKVMARKMQEMGGMDGFM